MTPDPNAAPEPPWWGGEMCDLPPDDPDGWPFDAAELATDDDDPVPPVQSQ